MYIWFHEFICKIFESLNLNDFNMIISTLGCVVICLLQQIILVIYFKLTMKFIEFICLWWITKGKCLRTRRLNIFFFFFSYNVSGICASIRMPIFKILSFLLMHLYSYLWFSLFISFTAFWFTICVAGALALNQLVVSALVMYDLNLIFLLLISFVVCLFLESGVSSKLFGSEREKEIYSDVSTFSFFILEEL